VVWLRRPRSAPAGFRDLRFETMEKEITMTVNEGTLDRALRVVAGLVLLSLVVIGPQTLWGLVGIVPLATGLLGYCPAYSILGIRTCSLPKD
jgi:hypothetical protein